MPSFTAILAILALSLTSYSNATIVQTYAGTGSNSSDTYQHFPLADIGYVQSVSWKFTDVKPTSLCNYYLCARGLSQPPEALVQWPRNCGRNLVNISASTNREGSFYLPIGSVTFSVLSQPSALSTTDCQFSLEVTIMQCDDGSYGADCQQPNLPTPTNNATDYSIPIISTEPYPIIAVSPTSRTSAAISVNVTLRDSNGNTLPNTGITVFERDGNVPIYNVTDPICDLNVTSSGDFNAAVVNITTPSERHMSSDREHQPPRYFLSIHPNNTLPPGAQLFVTTREYNCTSPYIGSICGSIPPALSLPGPLLTLKGSSFTAYPSWLYFAVFVSEQFQNDFSIGVSVPDGFRAPDMYLRLGGLPTATIFDAVVESVPSTDAMSTVFYESGETNVDGRPPWYLGLNYPAGYVDGGTNMQLLIFNGEACPNSCSERGACVNHRCQCEDGWTGVQCELEMIDALLSPAARVLLPLITILGGIALGVLICFHFRRKTDSAYHMSTLVGSGLLGALGARQHPDMPASVPISDAPRRGGLSQPPAAAAPRPSAPRAPGASGSGPRGNIHSFSS